MTELVCHEVGDEAAARECQARVAGEGNCGSDFPCLCEHQARVAGEGNQEGRANARALRCEHQARVAGEGNCRA